MFRLIVLIALVVGLAVPFSASACPLCKEAIPADVDGYGGDGYDPTREARAWNNSIYLFLSMPYLLVGVVGICVYRAMKKTPAAHTLAVPPAGQEANDVLSDRPQTLCSDHLDRGSDGQPG